MFPMLIRGFPPPHDVISLYTLHAIWALHNVVNRTKSPQMHHQFSMFLGWSSSMFRLLCLRVHLPEHFLTPLNYFQFVEVVSSFSFPRTIWLQNTFSICSLISFNVVHVFEILHKGIQWIVSVFVAPFGWLWLCNFLRRSPEEILHFRFSFPFLQVCFWTFTNWSENTCGNSH